tara:strand:+ start:88 stop:300 length:213 start_codon:yes stop_codon:yes gene_type:complete
LVVLIISDATSNGCGTCSNTSWQNTALKVEGLNGRTVPHAIKSTDLDFIISRLITRWFIFGEFPEPKIRT